MNNTIEYDNVKNKLELSNIFDITEKYDDNGSQKTIVSPGTILRNMREQDKMSVRDTAKKLFLETSMIRSLEGDKYDVLPDVFVRGYLRNYAKLQKIPQNTIMESFDTMVSQQPILSPVKPELKPYLMKQTSFAQGFLSVVGIFIVIITLAIWKWQSTTNNVFQSPEEIWSPTNFMTQTVENIAKSDIVLPTVMVQTDMDAIVAKKVPIKTFTNPYRILRIHFKDKAWIKLVDKERKELYQGIGNIGEILSLEGVPPFNIKVGNFAGVYIEYNNKIDNVKTFSRSQSNKRTFIIGVLDMDHFEN